LQPIISNDLSNSAFPFGNMQEIDIGFVKARAHRITYVGELGWEIYVSNDFSSHVFETIMNRNKDYPIKLCGLHTMDSCRIEKGYKHFGHDISNEDHALEAGLGFVIKENKAPSKFGDMIGKEAIIKKKNEGLENIFLQFRLQDPDPLLYHNEPILRDGTIVGYLTSGNYGHYLKGAIGLGYIKCNQVGENIEKILNSSYEIDVAGKRVKADVSLKPMYDHKSTKIKL
ncbi:MAG: 4-methylaminobutanoate oxidase (formaldehyde-forming), partial [Alphaproteobacteria bacterium MarineAlpha9_Bin3]